MHRFTASATAAASLALGACSDGIYSATSEGDGNVVVVNRMTGEARSIHGDTVVEVKPASAPKQGPDPRPALSNQTVPNQPFSIRGVAKYRDGSMQVRIRILPANFTMSEEERAAWRAHMLVLQQSATLNFEFDDDEGFSVARESLPLTNMMQLVDPKGDLEGLTHQLTISMGRRSYEEIRDWSIGWNGYWPMYYPPPPASLEQKTPPKPKT